MSTPASSPSSFHITPTLLQEFHNHYTAPTNAAQHIARNALTHASLSKVLVDPNRVNALHTTFSDELDITTTTSDQQASGRCWLFSFLNVLRAHMVHRYELDAEFEFSQSYLYFWDQFEKSNWFLHTIWTLHDKPTDDPHVRELLKEPISDGGQWHMIQNLVEKYGVVPRHAMHESYQANSTGHMTTLLSTRLREFARQLRQPTVATEADYARAVKPMMYEIYTILCVFLGEPPQTIRWEYNPSAENWAKEQWKQKTRRNTNKDSTSPNKRTKASTRSTTGTTTIVNSTVNTTTKSTTKARHQLSPSSSSSSTPNTPKDAIDKKPFEESKILTPVDFYRTFVKLPIEDYVTVIHYPHPTRPYHRCFTVKYLNNMVMNEPSTCKPARNTTSKTANKTTTRVRRSKLYNVPIDMLKAITRRSIDAGEPVWFCADIGKDGSGKYGILDPAAFQYPAIFGPSCVPFGWDKGERMMYKDGVPNHAMVLRGYHVEPPASKSHSEDVQTGTPRKHVTCVSRKRSSSTKRSSKSSSKSSSKRTSKSSTRKRSTSSNPSAKKVTKTTPQKSSGGHHCTTTTKHPATRWLVENSWGSLAGIDGNYVMSDEWFSRHVYEVAVHKRHLKGLWKGTAKSDADTNDIVLEMWDVFGSLFD